MPLNITEVRFHLSYNLYSENEINSNCEHVILRTKFLHVNVSLKRQKFNMYTTL